MCNLLVCVLDTLRFIQKDLSSHFFENLWCAMVRLLGATTPFLCVLYYMCLRPMTLLSHIVFKVAVVQCLSVQYPCMFKQV